MKQAPNPSRRAAWLLLAAPVLIATPALAQDATVTPTPPPPVRATLPQSGTPAQTPPPSRETGRPTDGTGVDPSSRTTIAPGAADVVDDARVAATPRAERRAAPRQVTRTATRTTTTTTRPAAPAAPVAAPAATTTQTTTTERSSPPAAAPTATPAPAAPEAAAPAATESAQTTTKTQTEGSGVPLWPLALIVLAIVGIGAFFLMRRRRDEEVYEEYVEEPVYAEPAYVEPVAVAPEPVVDRPAATPVAAVAAAAAPIAAAPALDRETAATEHAAAGLAEEATVSDAPAEDVAALTDGAPPVRNRPWLELAMRPVRAGTNADEALVEIELTVANSGTVPAQDVRVSTFMLTDSHASEMENMLVDTPADAAIDPVTIAPGEGTRIDATLAALKADLGMEGRFTPVVVADARYRLPDGSEGRTSASFVVGLSDEEGGTLIPIDLADRVMREDVEARLHGEPEHA